MVSLLYYMFVVHVQVIMPNTACDGANATRLYKMIGDQFPTSNLVTVQRRYFNETKGELWCG